MAPNKKRRTLAKLQDDTIASEALQNPQRLPLELQQLLLNSFKDTFSSDLDEDSGKRIQQVKQHLYNRDFDAAFGEEELRAVYSARWSPSRALAYGQILASLPVLQTGLTMDPAIGHDPSDFGSEGCRSGDFGRKETRIVCIGAGGGAEVVALSGYLNTLNNIAMPHEPSVGSSPTGPISPLNFRLTAIDIADWRSITKRLQSTLTTPPQLSDYASSGAKAAAAPVIEPNTLEVDFVKLDVLNMEVEEMGLVLTNAYLVTLMFTLNELYSTSITATTNLLLSLTMILNPGSLLLVVDCPGNYSTVQLKGKSATKSGDLNRRYPMQWLLNHTLLEASTVGSSKTASGNPQWEKIETRESEWFRLSSELRYPIPLEDMRYQLHLYRHL
ncbi:hypothetical protein MMC21_000179 [Puttea exsequens]|nr:hypothetical protein [Puttea exsequens]